MGGCYNKTVTNLCRKVTVALINLLAPRRVSELCGDTCNFCTMSTNYQKQIAKNKGAIIATFAVAFLATYAVMGEGGAQSDDLSAAVVGSGTPTITNVVVEMGKAGDYLRTTGSNFSATNNLITVCRVTTAFGGCDSKPNSTVYIPNVKASTTAGISTIYVFLPEHYSGGSPTVTSAKHRVYVLNNTTKKYSNAVTLASLVPTTTPQKAGYVSLSLNANTPPAAEVICTEGPDANECSKVPMLSFNLKAQKQDVVIDFLTLNVLSSAAGGGGNNKKARSITAHLYNGSIELDARRINNDLNGVVVFKEISISIPKDTTKTLTLKIDVNDTDNFPSNFSAQISAAGVGTINSSDSVGGRANGNTITFRNIGPIISLISKSVYTTGVPQAFNSTSTLVATFNVRLKAVGGDIVLGTVASRTPAFSSSTGFRMYKNGVWINPKNLWVYYPAPSASSGVITGDHNNSFILSEQSEVTIPVTVVVSGRDGLGRSIGSSAIYSIGMSGVQWFTRSGIYQNSNFMGNDTTWRTAQTLFP